MCPTCSHRSVKFDPFTYLTLQLPSSKARVLSIVVLAVDGSAAPTLYSVSVPISGLPACVDLVPRLLCMLRQSRHHAPDRVHGASEPRRSLCSA